MPKIKFEWVPIADFNEPSPEDLLAAERMLSDSLSRVLEVEESIMWAGFSNARTSSASVQPTLTLETIERTMREHGLYVAPPENPWKTAFSVPRDISVFPNMASIKIVTNKYLGDQVTPVAPPMPRGPYLQRRIKRWRQRHPSYTVGKGEYWLVSQREIWCHPDDFANLQEALADFRPAESEGI